MKKIFTLFLFSLAFQSFGQALSFDQVGTDPAYCRLFGYQNGNGVLYVSATGGTPPYSYLMTNLQTMATTTNGVWGGLNPGDYEVKIWDDVGDSIVQIVTVDSLNPIASIGVVPGSVTGSNPIYTGSAPVNVEFINQCQQFANPNNPNADTTFFWRLSQYAGWLITHNIYYQPDSTYNYGGDYEITLVARNKNGCTDTARLYLWILGELSVEENLSQVFTIITNPDQHQLILSSEQFQPAELKIYDVSGKLIYNGQIQSNFETIQFDRTGVFLFELIDPENDQRIQSGKFNM